MNKNDRLKKITKYLGVELDEIFKIKNSSYLYKINEEYGFMFFDEFNKKWIKENTSINQIIVDPEKIIKYDILSEVEKAFLRQLLSRFSGDVTFLQKVPFQTEGIQICIYFKNGSFKDNSDPVIKVFTGVFKKTESFKNMEMLKKYSFEELKL